MTYSSKLNEYMTVPKREFFYLMSETIFSKEKGLFDLYDQDSSYFYISDSWKTKNIDEYYFVG